MPFAMFGNRLSKSKLMAANLPGLISGFRPRPSLRINVVQGQARIRVDCVGALCEGWRLMVVIC